MIVMGIRRKESLLPIPLTIIPLTRLRRNGYGGQAIPFGATKRAHGGILAQRAEIVHCMVCRKFSTRYPCKH